MFIRELGREECQKLLEQTGFGRLACVRDGEPYIVPLFFASSPSCLYGFSTLGQKIDWMRSNPRVCIEVDEVRGPCEWTSVILRGRYEEFSDTPDHAAERLQAQSKLEHVRSLWWQTGLASVQTRARFDRDITIFYRIHIQEITGRRASADPVARVEERRDLDAMSTN